MKEHKKLCSTSKCKFICARHQSSCFSCNGEPKCVSIKHLITKSSTTTEQTDYVRTNRSVAGATSPTRSRSHTLTPVFTHFLPSPGVLHVNRVHGCAEEVLTSSLCCTWTNCSSAWKESGNEEEKTENTGRCQVWSLAVTICMFSLLKCCRGKKQSSGIRANTETNIKITPFKSHRTLWLCSIKFKSVCAASTTHGICVSSCASHKTQSLSADKW